MGAHPAPFEMRLIILAAALSAIGIEYLIARLRHADRYDTGETIATLVIALIGRLINLAAAGALYLPISWVYRHRLMTVELTSAWTWPALFLGVELCYYWHHRAMHAVNWLWAA